MENKQRKPKHGTNINIIYMENYLKLYKSNRDKKERRWRHIDTNIFHGFILSRFKEVTQQDHMVELHFYVSNLHKNCIAPQSYVQGGAKTKVTNVGVLLQG